MSKYNILITNDDGIDSPGLRAAVSAVMDLGNVILVAPSHQQTGAGRGMTGDKLACLEPIRYHINGLEIPAYHCDCSPALIVRHSLTTLLKDTVFDLLIAGINYGENLGINITSSGTVGATLEGASFGIPGIAISKQTDIESHHNYTDQDWSASLFFLRRFAKALLSAKVPDDVDVLKIDIPGEATPATKVAITTLARTGYYAKAFLHPLEKSRIGDGKTVITFDRTTLDPNSDIFALAIDRCVSVTPLSVDLTSRVKLVELQKLFGA